MLRFGSPFVKERFLPRTESKFEGVSLPSKRIKMRLGAELCPAHGERAAKIGRRVKRSLEVIARTESASVLTIIEAARMSLKSTVFAPKNQQLNWLTIILIFRGTY